MPATYDAYPTVDEVIDFVTSSGIAIPAGFDLDPFVFDAIKEWERLTRYRPFLAANDGEEPPEMTEAEYLYDPPGPNSGYNKGGSRTLFLDRGFVAISEIATGVTLEDTDGTVLDTDAYRLLPLNAAIDNVPYTMVEFAASRWGTIGSIKVTGSAGYSEVLTADVWNAIRMLAAAGLVTAIEQSSASKGDKVTIEEGDMKEVRESKADESSGSSESPIEGWRAKALATAMQYRRLTY